MSWYDLLIAGAGYIGKGSLGKVGADLYDRARSILNIPRNKNTDNLDNENRYYCPFCGEAIDIARRRTMCLGVKCDVEVVYGATRQERKEAAKRGFEVGLCALLLLFLLIHQLSSNLGFDITLELRLTLILLALFLTLSLLVMFKIGVLWVSFEEKKHKTRPPRCFKYSIATNSVQYSYVEEKVCKIKQDV